MNPKPSLVQVLVLYDVADDGVWFDAMSGKWHSTHLSKEVSMQMEILLRDGYITISSDVMPTASLTASGHEVLGRRSLLETANKVNRR